MKITVIPAKAGIQSLVLLTSILFTSCTQIQMLPYLDQVMTLQEMGNEKSSQGKFVLNIDAKFEKLVASIQSGDIKRYKTQNDIIQSFGPPILVKDIAEDGKILKRSLYRYAIQSKGPHKVYLYFDHDAHLSRWEYL